MIGIIGVGVVKDGCDTLLRTLKLAECQGEMNGINQFWRADTNSGKLKVALAIFLVVVVKNECGLLKFEILKAAVSQKLNWWKGLIFCVLLQIQESSNSAWWKIGEALEITGLLNRMYLNE